MYRIKKERPKEPEQTPFPKTYESEASAAANEKRVRDSLKEWDYEETPDSRRDEIRANIAKSLKHIGKSAASISKSRRKYAGDEPRPIEMALLAALLSPDAAKNPRSAYEKAWAFLNAELENIPFEELSTADMEAKLRKDLRIRDALVGEWKLNIGPRISFSDALQAEWFEHTSLRTFKVTLKNVGYPPLFSKDGGQITEAAYRLVLERADLRRKKLDAQRRRKSRAKPLQQPKKQDSL